MAKWSGLIGYATLVETALDVWTEEITERKARGDILHLSRRLQTTDQVNDSIVMTEEISFVADPYAREHYADIRYVTRGKVKWKVTSVEVAYPRLKLTIGGVYNGNA